MGLNVQFIDMQTDDFSPVDAFGYDKYQMGQSINRAQNINKPRSGFLGKNTVFANMRHKDRASYEDIRSVMDVVDVDRGDGKIESWTSYADMKNIGRVNHLNIMSYRPVRKLMEQGRISGFGYEPESIPTLDIIGRMINNGQCDVNEDGSYHRKMYRYSDDLPYTRKDLDRFEMQRKLIDLCLQETDLDPTDTNLERT